MRKILLAAALLCGFSLFAQTEHMVDVTSNVFTPANLVIEAGDIVTWTNLQGTHNVNGELDTYPNNPEGFGNNVGPVGWTYSFTFNTPGTYDYQCDPHVGLGMVGQVVVTDVVPTANVVITEIMYNPPESGNDSLEFVELFNAGTETVDLSGWSVAEGFVLSDFGNVSLAAGEYLILAVNADAFINTFNYGGTVIEWEDGALGNGGEDIQILDASGALVDVVDYDDEPLWPTSDNGTDGEGASIVLCDVSADNNDPLNWQASSASTGIIIEGREVLASPGAAETCAAPEPIIFWLEDFITVNEDEGTVTIAIAHQNAPLSTPIADIDFGAGNTATNGSDFTLPFPLPNFYGSGPNAADTFMYVVNIIDDADIEPTEIIEIEITGTVATVVGNPVLTINIFDNDSEVVVSNIADINDVDADGNAIFVDSVVTLQGVVHCLDFDGNDGYQFWMIEPDTGDGILVFAFNDVGGYQATEGDELQITGELDQFRGQFEIIPNQITVLSTGNDLVAPETVTALSEEIENKYVTLALSTETPTEDFFVEAGPGFNVTTVAQSGDTFNIRVEFDTDIDSTFIADFFTSNAANGITITGLVSQRDFDAPFLEFYQLYPCSQADFGFLSSVQEPSWAADLKIYPNPVSSQLTVELPILAEQFRLLDGLGRVTRFGQVASDKLQIDLSQLPKGMYYLQLMDGQHIVTRPVIKQ